MKKSLYKCGVDLIILSLLVETDHSAAELSAMISERSSGVIDQKIGTLYPILFSLEESGYIISQRAQSGRPRGTMRYHIAPSGVEFLQGMLPAYRAYSNACLNLLPAIS